MNLFKDLDSICDIEQDICESSKRHHFEAENPYWRASSPVNLILE